MTVFNERIAAYAKINLFLKVLGKRQDGYHLLSTLMQSVSICDYITVECSDRALQDGLEPGISITADAAHVPGDARNTAYKAARAFLNLLGRQNVSVKIHIQKGIPIQAGMAGGSTDAAAVLNALACAFPAAANTDVLLSMAARIGADVPFCMAGGTQLCEGIGDILTPVPSLCGLPLLFIKPKCSISTPWAFSVFDSLDLANKDCPEANAAIQRLLVPRPGTDPIQRITDAAPFLCNDLEYVADREYPILSEIRAFLMDQGAVAARMSGSGSTVFGIFSDKKTRDTALEHAGVYQTMGYFVKAGETV
ncbi:MAG: 4-(cytidine 5'-diphospho)-2-C-methyl-D-erythritol kinase [Eubacteriales bacterium]